MDITIKKRFDNLDIVTAFRELANMYLSQFEYSGCDGMYYLSVAVFAGVKDCTIQVYPNDKIRSVWIEVFNENGENELFAIDSIPFFIQKHILKRCANVLGVEIDIS